MWHGHRKGIGGLPLAVRGDFKCTRKVTQANLLTPIGSFQRMLKQVRNETVETIGGEMETHQHFITGQLDERDTYGGLIPAHQILPGFRSQAGRLDLDRRIEPPDQLVFAVLALDGVGQQPVAVGQARQNEWNAAPVSDALARVCCFLSAPMGVLGKDMLNFIDDDQLHPQRFGKAIETLEQGAGRAFVRLRVTAGFKKP
ncbi:hypothetical protein FQZ97_1034680 [compost metagenome]